MSELPAKVKEVIARIHPEFTIHDPERQEKDGITYYQVELKEKDKEDLKMWFTATGEVAERISYMK